MKEAKEKKFKCIDAAVQNGISVINLFAGIDEYTAMCFTDEFRYLENISSAIQVRVNSAGGSVLHGWSIVDIILNSSVPVEIVVVGVAASMASVITVAADNSKIMDYASVMVHNPFYSSGSIMDVEDQQLKVFRESLVKMYTARLEMSREDIESLMDGEEGQDGTWMTAEEAVSKGFVGEVIKTPSRQKKKFEGIIENSSDKAKEIQAKFQEVLDENKSQIKKREMIEEINAQLEIDANASVDTAKSKIKDLQNRVGELTKSQGALEVSNTSLQTELGKAKEEVTAKADKIVELENKVSAFEQAQKDAEKAEREEILDSAVKDGRIPEGEKEVWANLLESNAEAAKSAIANLTPTGEKKPLSKEVKASKEQKSEEVKDDAKDTPALPTISAMMADIASKQG